MDKLLSASWANSQVERNTGSYNGKLSDDTMKIYHGMQFMTPDCKCTVQEILDVLEEYAIGITNESILYFKRESRKKVKPLIIFIAAYRPYQNPVISMKNV